MEPDRVVFTADQLAAPSTVPPEDRLRRMLADAVQTGKPLPPAAHDAAIRIEPDRLRSLLRDSSLRETLFHAPPHLRGHAKRASFTHKKHLRLCDLYGLRFRGQVRAPQPEKLLDALRVQWHRTIGSLPPDTRAVLEYYFQVGLCPRMIAECMPGKVALCFSTSPKSAHLQRRPVLLASVQVHWLAFEETPNGRGRPLLQSGDLALDDDGTLQLCRRAQWDFGKPPTSDGGSGRRVPLACVSALADGVALHGALERAVVSGAGFQPGLTMPRVYVASLPVAGGDDDGLCIDPAHPQPVTPGMVAIVSDRLDDALASGDSREAIRSRFLADEDSRWRVDPVGWLREEQVPDGLLQRCAQLRGLCEEARLAALSDPAMWPLVAAVGMSEVRQLDKAGRRVLFPLEFLAGRLGDVARGRELYLRFRDTHFGRDVYDADGQVHFDREAAAAQVLDVGGA